MKIALVCPYNMFERAGGVTQQVIHLHEGLKKKGHNVKIITPKPSGFNSPPPADYIFLGTSRNFKSGLGLGVAGDWGMELVGDEIETVLENEKFDVIHFHEPWAPILGWQMLKESRSAHVGTFHANLIDSVAAKSWVGVFAPYGRSVSLKMHVITAVSPAPAELFKIKANMKEKKVVQDMRFIPNGIDLKVYRPFKKRLPLNGPNTQTIVYVGRLDKRKGIDWLIKSFALLLQHQPNAHLIIAGEGGQRSRLEQLVKTLKLNNVSFTGYVSEEEKRRLLGNADLTCFPALFGESFGIVLLESMAMGTPLLAGNNIGYVNVMTDYGRLGLIDPRSTADFANRMEIFLTDNKIRKEFRQWELSSVKQYDFAKIIDRYEAVYKEAIAKWRIEQHINEANGKHGKKFWRLKNRLALRRQSR